MLRMITAGGRSSFCDRAATSMPFIFGIPMSTMSVSGWCSSQSRSASSPSEASATIVRSGIGLEQASQAPPDDAVVVSQQHAHA